MNLFNEITIFEHKLWASVIQPAIHIFVILVLAWVLYKVARKAIGVLQAHMLKKTSDAESLKRVGTLARVFRYIVSVVLTIVTIMLVLSEIGISIAPILAAAGVVGLAVGFGAQSLVKDFFTGFFLLLENQVRQGDIVEVAGKSGCVEEVTLRYIRMRDYDGNVHYVPNGTITSVTNKSRVYSYAVVDIRVAYREDMDEVFSLIRKIGHELRADPVFGTKILEELEIAGVEGFTDNAIMVRARAKVLPSEQANVRRELLRRVTQSLSQSGVEPYALPAAQPPSKSPAEPYTEARPEVVRT
jgi:small conductance mechanosensitive channel